MVKTTVITHAHLANIVSFYHNLVAVRYSCTRGALGRPLVGIYQDLLCSFLNNVCVFSVGLLEHEVSSPKCIPFHQPKVYLERKTASDALVETVPPSTEPMIEDASDISSCEGCRIWSPTGQIEPTWRTRRNNRRR